MPRLQPVTTDSENAAAAEVLKSVEKKLGVVPNVIATMANSPAVAKAYLGFSQALAGGALPARLREQLALVVGETNSCDYCVAAHTALGQKAGLSEQEATDARRAAADDERERAVLRFAQQIVRERGWVSDEDVQQVREAALRAGAFTGIAAAVALNLFTNYLNHVAQTEVDFPAAPQLATT